MSDSLKRRVAGSLRAVEFAQLLESHEIEDADFMDGFLSRLNRDFGCCEIETAGVKPEPIARLGATRIPFGSYDGMAFDEIPLEYLDWLCRSQEEFYKQLRAYLKHPELKSRRGEA